MTDKKIRVLKIIWFPFLFVILTSFKFLQRDHESWEDKARLSDGSTITIYTYHSNYKAYGDPGYTKGHTMIFLYRPLYKIEFLYNGKKIKWKSKYAPLVLNLFKGSFYLVELGKEKKSDYDSFHYYRLEKKWSEISPNTFPKTIAIENIGLNENAGQFFSAEDNYSKGITINEFDMFEKLDPSFSPFRTSLTAKIWLELEKGIKYYKASYEVNREFLEEFKKKYLIRVEKFNIQKNESLGLNEKSGVIWGGSDVNSKKSSSDLNKKKGKLSSINFIFQFVLVCAFAIAFFNFGKRIILKNTNDEKKRKYSFLINYSTASIVLSFFYLKFFNDIVLFCIRIAAGRF